MDRCMRPGFRAWLGLVAATALLGAGTAWAEVAELTRAGIPLVTYGGMKLSLSGEINRKIFFADNGEDSVFGHIDDSANPNFVNLRGGSTQMYLDGIQLGFELEAGATSNPSVDFNFGTTDPGVDFDVRAEQVWADHAGWGRAVAGYGATINRFALRKDLSRTERMHNNDGRHYGGLTFATSAGGGTGITVLDVWPDLQTPRVDHIGATTKRYNGLQAGIAFANENMRELGVNYVNFDPDDTGVGEKPKIDAALGYVRNVPSSVGTGPDEADYRYLGSGSILLPNGVNYSFAYANQHPDASNQHTLWSIYNKLGYLMGKHAFSADYGWSRGIDSPFGKLEGGLFGLAWQMDLDPYYVGVGFEQYDAKTTEAGQPSLDAVRTFNFNFGVAF